ncbi:DUF5990 family protein [Nocardia alni]|uniref:DUF5990 family protein n=1 Tax=Nocardia alni TaxID=2815723 RepID=UPI0027E1751C|nr:DUF5990 family protein [Nocardia alni]
MSAASDSAVRLLVRIEGANLPGRECGPGGEVPGGYRDVHVAVQRRGRPDELFEPCPGDAASVVWTLECTASVGDDGIDIRGPQIQGSRGGRFIYLSWGTVDGEGAFTMFRRAKLMFDGIEPSVLREAVDSGNLVGRLGLTDPKGHPLCAAVRPPLISWSA